MLKKTLAMVVVFLVGISVALGEAFTNDPVAINNAAKSVLMLEVYDNNEEVVATGSGFIAFDNCTLITNWHVVEDAASIVGYSDDGVKYFIDKIVTADLEKDVAILRFDSPTDLIPLTFSDKQPLRADAVVAIGSPIGITNTVSLGNISAIYQLDNVPMIQFTAPISNGSSGGALLDNTGAIIGMTSATYEEAQNINLAVAAEAIIETYEQGDLTSEYEIEEFKTLKGDEYAELGYAYLYGEGVEPDYELAKEYLELAAQFSSAEGMRWLGNYYNNGVSGECDYKEAYKWYLAATEAGDETSMIYVGQYHLWGCYVEKNRSEARKWFECALVNGAGEAAFWLGEVHLDYKEFHDAKHWYEICLESKDAYVRSQGMVGLGVLYDVYGVSRFSMRDKESDSAAFEWYSKAVKESEENAQAQALLARCYYEGIGVEKDFDEVQKIVDWLMANDYYEGDFLREMFPELWE